ncbi:MAG: hypothetical protein GX556_14870 [Fibrobacter sp.]|nr:hypothetical protein [Fibrobacter sp.]
MRKNITCHHRLLIHLASRGDPNAFYTLASPYLHAIYMGCRNEGTPHDDICMKLRSEVKSLFRKISASQPENFDEWFRKQKNYKDLFLEDIKGDEKVEAECLLFLQDIQSSLLKCRGMAKKRRGSKDGMFALNVFPVPATLLLVALIVCGSAYLFLFFSGSNLKIEYKTPRKGYAFSIPFKSGTDTAASDSSITPPAQENVDTAAISRNLRDTVESKVASPKKRVAKPTKRLETPATTPSSEPRITEPITAQPVITTENIVEQKDTTLKNQ